jgi:hypothetical protein
MPIRRSAHAGAWNQWVKTIAVEKKREGIRLLSIIYWFEWDSLLSNSIGSALKAYFEGFPEEPPHLVGAAGIGLYLLDVPIGGIIWAIVGVS